MDDCSRKTVLEMSMGMQEPLELEATMAKLVSGVASLPFCVWYFASKHWTANNALGLARASSTSAWAASRPGPSCCPASSSMTSSGCALYLQLSPSVPVIAFQKVQKRDVWVYSISAWAVSRRLLFSCSGSSSTSISGCAWLPYLSRSPSMHSREHPFSGQWGKGGETWGCRFLGLNSGPASAGCWTDDHSPPERLLHAHLRLLA